MSVRESDEASRLRLYHRATETFGPDEADTLMQYLPTSYWQDVATKDDVVAVKADVAAVVAQVADLRAEMRRDFATKMELAELRGEMHIGFAQVDAKMEQQFRAMQSRMITTMIALFSLLGGLIIALH